MSKHVNYLWDAEQAANLSPAERLVYRSNLLGADRRITNTGGGNTSAKLMEKDPLTGEYVEVLWVKGSGGDLRTSKLPNFASLYQSKVTALQWTYIVGAEDAIVDYYPHCAFDLNPRAASIDTPLHAFVPFDHVDHMHPNAVIAIAASRRSQELTREVFGDEVAWTPWRRPGFALGLELQRLCRETPKLKGVVLGQHGVINWADDDRECYDLTLALIECAAAYIEAHDKGERTFGGPKHSSFSREDREEILVELLPWLRPRVTSGKRGIATVDASAAVLSFVNSQDAERLASLGTSCPDHFLRTKIRPLYIPWTPDITDVVNLFLQVDAGLKQYRADYASYYERCKRPDSPAMRDPNPTVILIPGIGMIAWGKNKPESMVTAEFYACAVEVMRGAEAIDEYIALPEQEAFDIEYWQLEEAKLRRLPPEKELSRCVVMIAGLKRQIGQTVADRLAAEGAHVTFDPVHTEAMLTYGGLDYIVMIEEEEILVHEVAGAASHRLRTNTIRVTHGAPVKTQVEAVLFLASDRSAGIRDHVITV